MKIERNTVQRQLVYHAAYKLGGHPTADAVYETVVKKHPSISKGTVYRNLNRLSENGLLRRIQLPNNADRFDLDVKKHCHIICTECGRFDDLNEQYLNDVIKAVEQQTGYELDPHGLVFSGICPDCRKKCCKRQTADAE